MSWLSLSTFNQEIQAHKSHAFIFSTTMLQMQFWFLNSQVLCENKLLKSYLYLKYTSSSFSPHFFLFHRKLFLCDHQLLTTLQRVVCTCTLEAYCTSKSLITCGTWSRKCLTTGSTLCARTMKLSPIKTSLLRIHLIW